MAVAKYPRLTLLWQHLKGVNLACTQSYCKPPLHCHPRPPALPQQLLVMQQGVLSEANRQTWPPLWRMPAPPSVLQRPRCTQQGASVRSRRQTCLPPRPRPPRQHPRPHPQPHTKGGLSEVVGRHVHLLGPINLCRICGLIPASTGRGTVRSRRQTCPPPLPRPPPQRPRPRPQPRPHRRRPPAAAAAPGRTPPAGTSKQAVRRTAQITLQVHESQTLIGRCAGYPDSDRALCRISRPRSRAAHNILQTQVQNTHQRPKPPLQHRMHAVGNQSARWHTPNRASALGTRVLREREADTADTATASPEVCNPRVLNLL